MKIVFTILTLFIFQLCFSQSFKESDLLGKWKAEKRNLLFITTYNFLDSSICEISFTQKINNKNETEIHKFHYRVENLKDSNFLLTIMDVEYFSKDQCRIINKDSIQINLLLYGYVGFRRMN
jgi:hypothetical protein